MFVRARTPLAVLVAAASLALTAPAAIIGPLAGTGFGIPDGAPGGASSTISNPTGGLISDVTIAIDFGSALGANSGHTWVGDLTATLSFGGFDVDLFSFVETIPVNGFGDDSNLLGLYSFNDGFSSSLTDAASAAGDNDVIAPGNYAPRTLGNVATSLLATFGGRDAAGAWTLTVVDGVTGDQGGIVGWTLNLKTRAAAPPSAVPEPGSFTLLALGLLGLGAAVRRRQSS